MYKVKLQSFEGPFDLLVYLIENAEMSIYDIRISEITTQYLDYIRQMEEQEINVAQEFMVLAASLIEIKSRMILPRSFDEGEEVVEEDPRKELVQRIIEYKKFKEISHSRLARRPGNRRGDLLPAQGVFRGRWGSGSVRGIRRQFSSQRKAPPAGAAGFLRIM